MYTKRYENLINKIYLSRLSISNYSFYYGNLLKHLDFRLTDQEFHRVIEDGCFYLYEKMVEKENPIKIALYIVSEFESYIASIGACTDNLATPTADIRREREDIFSANHRDGKREKGTKFWRNKIQETVALVGGEESLGEIPSNARVFIDGKKKKRLIGKTN